MPLGFLGALRYVFILSSASLSWTSPETFMCPTKSTFLTGDIFLLFPLFAVILLCFHPLPRRSGVTQFRRIFPEPFQSLYLYISVFHIRTRHNGYWLMPHCWKKNNERQNTMHIVCPIEWRKNPYWSIHPIFKTPWVRPNPQKDVHAQIRTQTLWCCLRAVWTHPFTYTGSICFASHCASCVDEASG